MYHVRHYFNASIAFGCISYETVMLCTAHFTLWVDCIVKCTVAMKNILCHLRGCLVMTSMGNVIVISRRITLKNSSLMFVWCTGLYVPLNICLQIYMVVIFKLLSSEVK